MIKEEEEVIEVEFFRIAECLRSQGDINCLLDLIPYEKKKKFVEDWHHNDEESNYGHYHISVYDRAAHPKLVHADQEHVIEFVEGKHKVVDWDTDKTLGEFKTLKEALLFSFRTLSKGLKDPYIVPGAGCPPTDIINEVERVARIEG